MRTQQVTERIGERVGDVDWSYNFRSHFDNRCSGDARKDEACAESVAQLRTICDAIAAGKTVYATTDGGWPRCGFHRVTDVAMYDGWPWWRPVPSFLSIGPLGQEWRAFYTITEIQIKDQP